ncbi:MAG: Tol-Pal system beta propeller repeat protein TolB, partial [Deltaproteobacteria bacterium]|nr:Tol-Pal system beta propeller repeat protein TolB [Deltaproteobacteria bacterium]
MSRHTWLARRRGWWTLFGFMVLLGLPPSVPSQIRIDVPEPGGAGLPIAISPLKNLDGEGERKLGEEFADVIARDLDLSGLFKPIERGAYIEGPAGLSLEEINFQNWSVLGALALVKGGFSLDGDGLTVEVRLFDVAQRKQLGGKRYRGERRDLRRMAHRFADQIMFFLTGEQGPFNSKIAFVSNRGGGRVKEIYLTDLTGMEVTQVTKDRTLSLGPSWNPAGNVLTFFSYKQGGPYPYRIDLLSGQESRLYPVVGYSGRWSPDGTSIAVSLEQQGNSDLFLLSPEGRLIRRLTEHQDIDVSPTWSPDGREIAFCSSRSGGPQIYVMNVDSGSVRRLTFRGDYNTSPSWSPKGDRIAYTSRVGGLRIMTIDAGGGEPQEVTAGEDPSWSPDGRYLVFSYRGRLRIASKDGRSVKQLTGGGGDDTSP